MVNTFKKSIGMFLVAAVAGFAGAGAYIKIANNGNISQSISADQHQPARLVNMNRIPGEAGTQEFVTASETTVPAVVHVTTTYGATSAGNQSYNPFQDFFWGDRGFRNPAPSVSSGSGVIITDDAIS
jgi:hypothetical protein